MRPCRPRSSLRAGPRVDDVGAAAPTVRSEGELTLRTRSWTVLSVSVGSVLVHAADVVVLSTTAAPGDRTVVAATALPWCVAGLWAARALVRGTGVGPVGGSVALTAGCTGIAVDGALTGTAGQEVMCALGLMAIAIGLVVGGTASTVRASGPVVVALQLGMLLVAHRAEPAGWFLAVSAASVTAGVLVVVAWLQEERRATLTALATAAVQDPLTGLLNRRGMSERFELLRAAAPPGQRVAVIALDLDHFKAVNDAHGHDVGDRVLLATADLMRSQVRQHDLLVRLGGEELAWLGAWDGPEEAVRAADRLRAALGTTPVLPGVTVTVSAGVACADTATQPLSDGEALSRLLVRADRALYRAKEAGRDRVELAVAVGAA